MNDDLLLICSLVEDYGGKKKWIFFCEDETIINLPGIVKVLNKYDARKVSFLRFLSVMNVNVLMLLFGLSSASQTVNTCNTKSLASIIGMQCIQTSDKAD